MTRGVFKAFPSGRYTRQGIEVRIQRTAVTYSVVNERAVTGKVRRDAWVTSIMLSG